MKVKILKRMDYKGQTTALSAIVVFVGMVLLVPGTTEKALASINASATGICGPEGKTELCQFTLVDKRLDKGSWSSEPTQSGTKVSWSTTGNVPLERTLESRGDEKGSVTYDVSLGPGHPINTAVLSFESPLIGHNKCSIIGIRGDCAAGSGYNGAVFKYDLRGP